jgi:hypothetical protein
MIAIQNRVLGSNILLSFHSFNKIKILAKENLSTLEGSTCDVDKIFMEEWAELDLLADEKYRKTLDKTFIC